VDLFIRPNIYIFSLNVRFSYLPKLAAKAYPKFILQLLEGALKPSTSYLSIVFYFLYKKLKHNISLSNTYYLL